MHTRDIHTRGMHTRDMGMTARVCSRIVNGSGTGGRAVVTSGCGDTGTRTVAHEEKLCPKGTPRHSG